MREEGIQTQTAYTDSRMITCTCMRAICVGACLALCRNYECNCRLLLLLFVLLCLHALIMSVPKAWKAEAFRAATKRECPRAARQVLVCVEISQAIVEKMHVTMAQSNRSTTHRNKTSSTVQDVSPAIWPDLSQAGPGHAWGMRRAGAFSPQESPPWPPKNIPCVQDQGQIF